MNRTNFIIHGTDFYPVILYLLLAFSLFSIFYPRAAWWFDGGWIFPGSEPSKLKLFLMRLGGVIATLCIIYLIQNR